MAVVRSFSKVRRKTRLIFQGVINVLLYRIFQSKPFEAQNTFIICGSIRSGSTWLAELISSVDGHLQLFEPMHRQYVPEASKVVPTIDYYLNPDDDWTEGRSFFERIISGRLVNPWILSQASARDVVRANTLVVKLVRANVMLPWLSRLPNIRKPILVMRHPCATILSQLKKEWPASKGRLLKHPYLDRYPEIREKCNTLDKPEELAAASWCLRYHAPLFSASPQSFILVTYESLVRDGKAQLKKVFEEWGMPVNSHLLQKLDVPSDTSEKDSFIKQGKDPLEAWRAQLSEEQVDNVLNVLGIFGLNFYTRELEPDYKMLEQFECFLSNRND